MTKLFQISIFLFLCISGLQAQSVRTIAADYQKVKGERSTVHKICVGAGRANEGLRADWQQQLREVKENCDFQYIRFHGLLHDDMGVCFQDERGYMKYNFQYIDLLYDFLLSIGVKPFVELSFTPSLLKSGEKTVFWWKGNVSPPKSYEQYNDLILKLAEHLTARYGKEEVKSWYFEVWNEPNHPHFFTGTMDDYFEMYENVAKTIKKVCPDYRVGGPASAGNVWVKELLDFCKAKNVPIDFISTHMYGVKGDGLDEYGVYQLYLERTPDFIPGLVRSALDEIKESHLPGAELHYTEWSSSYSPRDPTHDTYQNATYVLNTLKKTEDIAASMSYWTFTDIFEESGVPPSPFHGGFGMMTVHGIRKPTFYSFSFMNQLGNTELANKDGDSWVCRDEQGNVQVLAWDFTLADQKKESNQVYYRKDLPANAKGELQIEITNMENGEYAYEIYLVGYRKNDPFTSYYDMKLPDHLSKQQEQMLKSVSSGNPEKRTVITISNNNFKETLPLRENDIYLLKLIKL